MSGFLDNYELANDTIKRFWVEHPTGRILPIIVDIDLTAGWVLFKVEVYREYEDHQPSAIGHAYGNVTYYPANMRRWFIEDSETSAIARAIKLLTPSAERPSREDMQKVEALKPMADNTDFWATNPAAAAIPTLAEAVTTLATSMGAVVEPGVPHCNHGARVWRTGEKNGKAWGNYSCTEKSRTNQCAPYWYVLTSDGSWKPQL
jgi:hypothetical protein